MDRPELQPKIIKVPIREYEVTSVLYQISVITSTAIYTSSNDGGNINALFWAMTQFVLADGCQIFRETSRLACENRPQSSLMYVLPKQAFCS
jgi:hypothetical protein